MVRVGEEVLNLKKQKLQYVSKREKEYSVLFPLLYVDAVPQPSVQPTQGSREHLQRKKCHWYET